MIYIKLIVILIMIKVIECANILFISPTATYSHSRAYFPIVRELSLRGHKVVTIIPDLLNDPTLVNLTEFDVHDVAYKTIQRHTELVAEGIRKGKNENSLTKLMYDYSYDAVEILLQHPDVQDLITHPDNYHFDLVITEWLSFQSTVAFADLFKCPLIGISSYTLYLSGYDDIGSPTHSTYLSNAWDRFVNPASFWDRIRSFLNAIEYRHQYKNIYLPKHEQLVRKYFGNNVSSVEEIKKRVSLVLTNTNPILHGSYPKARNLIEIGGMHEQPFIPLPEDLETFLDEAHDGFLYFSLGSTMKGYLFGDIIKIALKVFQQLPYKILLKYESSNLPELPDNVFISGWVPQQTVLEHENIKLFITQGGLQSAEEAIRAQVPLLVIPLLCDQNKNAGRFVQLGIGKRLLPSEITELNLKAAILDIINNDSYKQSVTEVAETIWDQETNPLDRAIWWIEYVIRHKGAKYLRSPALDAPWYEVQLLDVYLFIFSIFVLFCVFVYIVNRQFFICIKSKTDNQFSKIKKY